MIYSLYETMIVKYYIIVKVLKLTVLLIGLSKGQKALLLIVLTVTTLFIGCCLYKSHGWGHSIPCNEPHPQLPKHYSQNPCYHELHCIADMYMNISHKNVGYGS